MPRHPAPDAEEARDAADAIIARRTAAHAADLHRLDDSIDGVVAYVAAGGPADDLDPAMVREDVVDALTALDYLDALYARRLASWRLRLIRVGQSAGMTSTALLEPLHQHTRQGFADLVDRLLARLDPEIAVADAKARRRTAAVSAADRGQLVARGAGIVAFARALIARRGELPADLDECGVDVDDLADRLPEPGNAPSPGLLAALRLIVDALAGVELETQLRAVVDHGAQLVAREQISR